MSMFTPVGVGGRKDSRRRRRRVWPLVALVLLVAAAAAATWWFLLRDPGPSKAAATTPTCRPVTPEPAALVAPKQVRVNVFNATQRRGLAASVGDRLHARGYAVGKIANDPLHHAVAGAAEIRYGTAGLQQARTVLALVPGAEMVADSRASAKVDLVLGRRWTALASKPVPPLVTPAPRPGCGGGGAPAAATSASR